MNRRSATRAMGEPKPGSGRSPARRGVPGSGCGIDGVVAKIHASLTPFALEE